MSKTIIIDPGHGGFDAGATYQGRKEKDDNLRLALAVGQKLEAAGYTVFYTRTDDRYDSPYDKAQIANSTGGDLFLSFHRNAAERPNLYQGIQALVYDKNPLALSVAKNVNEELEKIGFQNLGIESRKELVVLRRTQMPAVLLEVGFIDSTYDNELFDQRFPEIVTAIATGVERALPLSETAATEKAPAVSSAAETDAPVVSSSTEAVPADTSADEDAPVVSASIETAIPLAQRLQEAMRCSLNRETQEHTGHPAQAVWTQDNQMNHTDGSASFDRTMPEQSGAPAMDAVPRRPQNTPPANPMPQRPQNTPPANPMPQRPQNTPPANPMPQKPQNTPPANPMPQRPQNMLPSDAVPDPRLWYYVQVGLFRYPENAVYLMEQLKQQGFDAVWKRVGGLIAIWVGPCETLDEAVTLQRQLQSAGYETLIVSDNYITR